MIHYLNCNLRPELDATEKEDEFARAFMRLQFRSRDEHFRATLMAADGAVFSVSNWKSTPDAAKLDAWMFVRTLLSLTDAGNGHVAAPYMYQVCAAGRSKTFSCQTFEELQTIIHQHGGPTCQTSPPIT